MADREQVIKALECCQMVYECKPYEKCPYSNGLECGDCDINRLHYDALALLKEQDAVVLCKDCRHCTFSDGEQLADCMIKQGWFPVKPDWFCADGVPKEWR